MHKRCDNMCNDTYVMYDFHDLLLTKQGKYGMILKKREDV